MPRVYTDKGLLSKDSALMVYDETLSKYKLLIPTTDLPETKSAPSTQEKTVLTDHSITEIEGLQSNSQKTYTFNYHRDNLIQLNKYVGKTLRFMEVNPDLTGEKFTGSLVYGRSSVAVDGIVQGQIFITVNSAEDLPVTDVRDLIVNTAICTTPLNDIELEYKTSSVVIDLEGLPSTVSFTATSKSDSIATATISGSKLTITGVAEGNTMVELKAEATGEATSYRTISVTVPSTSAPVGH